MRKMRNTVLIAVVALAAMACNKSDDSKTFYWLETKCSDPWGTNSNATLKEKEEAITDYLKEEEGIKVESVSIEYSANNLQFCEACMCQSGNTLEVTIKGNKESEMEALGFQKEK